MKKKIIIGGISAAVIVAIIVLVFVIKNPKPYNYDLKEYVKVGNYKNLKYTRPEVKISEKDVENEINTRLMQASKEETVKSGKVEDGDTVNISYEGKIDGKTFEGGTAENQDVTIGQTPMIDGFIDGLKGKKIGEKVTLNLKFPEDYHEKKVAGKDVVFNVTINSKKLVKTPKLDEKFVKDNSDYKTIKEYKKGVKSELKKRAEKSVDSQIKQQLWQQIMADSKAKKYPEKEMKDAMKKADEWESQYKSQATAYNMSWEDYLKNAMNTDKKGFAKIKKNYAKDIVLNEMVLYYIADKEDIKLSHREFKDQLDEIMKESGYTDKSFKEAFNMDIEKYAEQNNWKQSMLLDKVLDEIMKMGKKQKLSAKEQAEFEKMQQGMMPEETEEQLEAAE